MKTSANVIFVTAATFTCRVLKGFKPATLIIDEATQITEVASVSVVASFIPSIQKVILAGDLMQNCLFIGSIRRNEFSSTTERSLIKRMLFTGVPSSLLGTQYRMHPHISEMISKLLYEGRLIDGENVKHREEDKIFQRILPVLIPGFETT